jgi:hypothetical protein
MKKSQKKLKPTYKFKTVEDEEEHFKTYKRMIQGDDDAIIDILFEGGRCTKEDRDYYYNVLKNNEV